MGHGGSRIYIDDPWAEEQMRVVVIGTVENEFTKVDTAIGTTDEWNIRTLASWWRTRVEWSVDNTLTWSRQEAERRQFYEDFGAVIRLNNVWHQELGPGDRVWMHNSYIMRVDVGRAIMRCMLEEGALVGSMRTSTRTGVVSQVVSINKLGLDAWEAARLLALRDDHG